MITGIPIIKLVRVHIDPTVIVRIRVHHETRALIHLGHHSSNQRKIELYFIRDIQVRQTSAPTYYFFVVEHDTRTLATALTKAILAYIGPRLCLSSFLNQRNFFHDLTYIIQKNSRQHSRREFTKDQRPRIHFQNHLASMSRERRRTPASQSSSPRARTPTRPSSSGNACTTRPLQ